MEHLQQVSKEHNLPFTSIEFAKKLDDLDELTHLRDQFIIPKNQDLDVKLINPNNECIYLCSNSLGLQPKHLKTLVNQELEVWAKKGVLGHHQHDYSRPWVTIDEEITPLMAKLVGADSSEVALMATLTSNLHFLLTAFYKPDNKRYKILIEHKAFPSDHYAVESQLNIKNIKNGLILVKPREGEETLRMEDIYDVIEKEGESIAIVLLPGVQYYTGQKLDMKKITQKGHEKGCLVGFDLAHAVGNIKLELSQWNVDFACWCTYKYLSSGPGNIGGLYVNQKYAKDNQFKRLTGWWSHDLTTRFNMTNEMQLIQGAFSFRHSNPSVLSCVSLLSSLKIFNSIEFSSYLKKQSLLVEYLNQLMNLNGLNNVIKVITPENERGCQLSLIFKEEIEFKNTFDKLLMNGVVCDQREPNCIRIAPFPLVNRFTEVFTFVEILKKNFNL
ncbi:kynureninase-like protein [Neoconidiobolus thromboides FSU 785]|nr:kynureninase-like protein [Neoconidiobolus thromboides FSU 785]